MAREHLRLEDLSDREVLLVVADVAGESDGGFADALDIAARLDIGGEYPRRTVAVRLSWLARWGALQREHERDEGGNIRYKRDGAVKYTQRWGLTPVGWQVASGELRKGLETQLERVDDAQMVVLTRWVARRNGSFTARKLAEREWKREAMLRR